MLLLVLALADMASAANQTPTLPAPVAATTASASTTSAATPGSAASDAASPATAPPADATAADPAVSPATNPAPDAIAPDQSTAPVTSADITQAVYSAEPRDPWVKINRTIFSFDVALERHLLAPVAHGYNHVVPHVVRFHVTSALFNLEEPLTAVNDLLQLRIGSMGKTIFRFVVNSTVGIAGLFDVAKASGVPIHYSLFGQTLGRYGVKAGPYVMLPVLGPSNVRDGIGRLVDGLIDPVQFLVGGLTSADGLSLFVLEGVDWRSRADDTLKAVYSATDPYAFVRSAYTQSSNAAVSEATGKAVALPDFEAVPGTP